MSDTALVQEKIGVPRSDAWDQLTEQALIAWQRQHQLAATGVPDPMTLTAMEVYDPYAGAPGSFQRSLATGQAPGHFWRDVATATNQIPRWAWVALGVGFGGLAFLSWWQRGRGSE